jgi:arylsulfatase
MPWLTDHPALRQPALWRTALGFWLALCASCAHGREQGSPRNLLLVLLDTTRSDHLSCYGYGRETTPAIDGLAQGGVRFERAFAHSSLTPVSAGALLTGALPFRHGVRSLYFVGDGQALSADVESLFELLGRSGRRTAGFVSAKPMGRHYGLARGFGEYFDDFEATKERYGIARFGDAPQRPADETTELLLEWLDEHGAESFAVLLHLFDAHDPAFVPPREFLEGRLSFALPEELGRYVSDPAMLGLVADPPRIVELYDAELAFMDGEIERVLERLAALGVRDETLVVVTADHGEAFGEHNFYTHGLLYREHLQVPLVFQGPGLPVGRVIGARARLVDVFPTLVELFGLPRPTGIQDGQSLVDWIDGEPARDRDLYAEVHHAENDQLGREAEMYTLVRGRWKYVHRPASGRHELFDLAADPDERQNLYQAEPAVAEGLRLELEALGAFGGGAAALEELDPERVRELRELGY